MAAEQRLQRALPRYISSDRERVFYFKRPKTLLQVVSSRIVNSISPIFPTHSNFHSNSQHANATFDNTWYSFERILFMHKITEYTVPLRRKMYMLFKPVPKIAADVVTFVKQHDICNQAAIHVRRTDMELSHRRRSVTTDDEVC